MTIGDALMFIVYSFFLGMIVCFICDGISLKLIDEKRRRERKGFAVFRSLAGNYYFHDVMYIPEFINPAHECIVDGLTKDEARKYCDECNSVKAKYGK
jgi:hypothetical protein